MHTCLFAIRVLKTCWEFLVAQDRLVWRWVSCSTYPMEQNPTTLAPCSEGPRFIGQAHVMVPTNHSPLPRPPTPCPRAGKRPLLIGGTAPSNMQGSGWVSSGW